MKKPIDTLTKHRKWYTGNIGNIFWWAIWAIVMVSIYASGISDNIRIDHELHLYGIKIYGRVTGLYTETDRRYQPHYAHLVYMYNAVTYSKEIEDSEHHYKQDDTVIVKCSTKNPWVVKLIGERINGVDYPKGVK